jgi:transposase
MSADIRKRVLGFVERGGSKSAAARHYEVSLSSVNRWVQAGREWCLRRPGPKAGAGGRKIDQDALYKVVAQGNDLMLKELAQRFEVTPQAIHYALKRMGITRKKNGGIRSL